MHYIILTSNRSLYARHIYIVRKNTEHTYTMADYWNKRDDKKSMTQEIQRASGKLQIWDVPHYKPEGKAYLNIRARNVLDAIIHNDNIKKTEMHLIVLEQAYIHLIQSSKNMYADGSV